MQHFQLMSVDPLLGESPLIGTTGLDFDNMQPFVFGGNDVDLGPMPSPVLLPHPVSSLLQPFDGQGFAGLSQLVMLCQFLSLAQV